DCAVAGLGYLSSDPPRGGAETDSRRTRSFSSRARKKSDDLLNWPRLRQTLLDALRLYPPVAYISREEIADDLVAGEFIRHGTQVWISPWVMHRHRASSGTIPSIHVRPGQAFAVDQHQRIPTIWSRPMHLRQSMNRATHQG